MVKAATSGYAESIGAMFLPYRTEDRLPQNGRMSMRKLASIAALAAAAAGLGFVAAAPAIAATPVPGPLLGAGAPVLAVGALGYWLIRRYRQRGE